jgi:hypothetical protein
VKLKKLASSLIQIAILSETILALSAAGTTGSFGLAGNVRKRIETDGLFRINAAISIHEPLIVC